MENEDLRERGVEVLELMCDLIYGVEFGKLGGWFRSGIGRDAICLGLICLWC